MSKLVIPGVGYVLMKKESSYGSFASMAAPADVIYVEDMTAQYTADMLQRKPLSPARAGSMSRVGKRRIEWSATTELALPDAYDSSAMDPHGDELLQCSGFARENFVSASHESTFYTLQNTDHSSMSFEMYSFAADTAGTAGAANELRGRGARSDFELNFNTDDGRIMLACNGRALEQTTAADTWQPLASQTTDATLYADKPFLSMGTMHCELVDLATDTVYGGGTAGTPSNLWQVPTLSIQGAMSVTEQSGIAASQGVARQRLAPTDPVTMSISIEEAVYTAPGDGVWDPYALRDAESPIEVRLQSSQTDLSGDTILFTVNAYGQIISVDSTDADGRRLWDLTIELRYPEDAQDGAPAVGVSPTQVFDYFSSGGVSRGLFIDETLTQHGVLCLAFARVL